MSHKYKHTAQALSTYHTIFLKKKTYSNQNLLSHKPNLSITKTTDLK